MFLLKIISNVQTRLQKVESVKEYETMLDKDLKSIFVQVIHTDKTVERLYWKCFMRLIVNDKLNRSVYDLHSRAIRTTKNILLRETLK